MNQVPLYVFIGYSIFLGLILFSALLFYEDGKSFGLFRRICCKLNYHKTHNKVGKTKIHKYYCQNCKIPRKHPELRMIQGGNRR